MKTIQMRVEKASDLERGRKDSQITRCSVHVDKDFFQLCRSGQINNSSLILRGSRFFDVNQIGAERANEAERCYEPAAAGGAEIAFRNATESAWSHFCSPAARAISLPSASIRMVSGSSLAAKPRIAEKSRSI